MFITKLLPIFSMVVLTLVAATAGADSRIWSETNLSVWAEVLSGDGKALPGLSASLCITAVYRIAGTSTRCQDITTDGWGQFVATDYLQSIYEQNPVESVAATLTPKGSAISPVSASVTNSWGPWGHPIDYQRSYGFKANLRFVVPSAKTCAALDFKAIQASLVAAAAAPESLGAGVADDVSPKLVDGDEIAMREASGPAPTKAAAN